MKLLFEISHTPLAVAHGQKLQGDVKIIAAILEQPVTEKILTHLGQQAHAPPRASARRAQTHAT